MECILKDLDWAKRLRKALIAPPGYLVGAHDYRQGELMIVACLANEETMLNAYRNGMDLHSITASRLSGYTLEEFARLKELDFHKWEEIRFLGKAGKSNFVRILGDQQLCQFT